eukprot:6186827-Pleurochrysis_carterae.AAC.1
MLIEDWRDSAAALWALDHKEEEAGGERRGGGDLQLSLHGVSPSRRTRVLTKLDAACVGSARPATRMVRFADSVNRVHISRPSGSGASVSPPRPSRSAMARG